MGPGAEWFLWHKWGSGPGTVGTWAQSGELTEVP